MHIVSQLQRPFVVELVHDAAHERTLTLTVLPNEGNLVSTLDHQVYVREDPLVSKRFAHACHLHGIVPRAWSWWEAQANSRRINLIHLYSLQLL